MATAYNTNRAAAILTFPVYVVSILPGLLRRGAYWSDDRAGFVIIQRHRPIGDVLVVCAVAAATVVALAAALSLLPPLPHLVAACVLAAWYIAVVVAVVRRRTPGGSARMVGPETPHGQRWSVTLLAQRPGTHLTALLLTRRLIGTLPDGAVVIATADNDRLAAAYARLGFTLGPKRRMWHTIGNEAGGGFRSHPPFQGRRN